MLLILAVKPFSLFSKFFVFTFRQVLNFLFNELLLCSSSNCVIHHFSRFLNFISLVHIFYGFLLSTGSQFLSRQLFVLFSNADLCSTLICSVSLNVRFLFCLISINCTLGSPSAFLLWFSTLSLHMHHIHLHCAHTLCAVALHLAFTLPSGWLLTTSFS